MILKKHNDLLRNELKTNSIDVKNELLSAQENLEKLLAERDSYITLYTMAKIRAEKAEEKLNELKEQQSSMVELLVEKFGFVDRILDRQTILGRDLFKADTNIEIFANFNVQLSSGEQGFIVTGKSCPSGKFKVSIPGKRKFRQRTERSTLKTCFSSFRRPQLGNDRPNVADGRRKFRSNSNNS